MKGRQSNLRQATPVPNTHNIISPGSSPVSSPITETTDSTTPRESSIQSPFVETTGTTTPGSELDAESETPKGARDNSIENRIRLMATSYEKGCQILVKKPTTCQSGRLTGIHTCLPDTDARQNNNTSGTVLLMDLWQDLRKLGVEADKICSETYSHTKQLARSFASIHNVGCYLTGITQHRDLLPKGHCPPTKAQDTPAYYCGRAVERMLKLISKIEEYYGGDVARATFTFLESKSLNSFLLNLAN